MEERLLAYCTNFDLIMEDHGMPMVSGSFAIDNGAVYTLGYCIDLAFVVRLMNVFDVHQLTRINGKSCWITVDEKNDIIKMEPLHAKQGMVFDIREWQNWLKVRCKEVAYSDMTVSEMHTGVSPAK